MKIRVKEGRMEIRGKNAHLKGLHGLLVDGNDDIRWKNKKIKK
jgi:hypothetical protein